MIRKAIIKFSQRNIKRYSFIKEGNGENESYTLYFNHNEPVYKATKIKDSEDSHTFSFMNCKKKKETTHEISRRKKTEVDRLTFDFDGVDVWDRLSQLGIRMQITTLEGNKTDFHIFQGEEDFALARMERISDEKKKIKITFKGKNQEMLFFVFFVIARLNK